MHERRVEGPSVTSSSIVRDSSKEGRPFLEKMDHDDDIQVTCTCSVDEAVVDVDGDELDANTAALSPRSAARFLGFSSLELILFTIHDAGRRLGNPCFYRIFSGRISAYFGVFRVKTRIMYTKCIVYVVEGSGELHYLFWFFYFL